ncbi:MAG: T9SS type A sorting domain-containing protein [Ignavibacteria bacterium]|nr:T9SS type A sorting domain-containing protein [Ignavibacteria bacterium]
MRKFLLVFFILFLLNEFVSAQASIKPVCPQSVTGNFGNTFAVDVVIGDPVPVVNLFSASFTLTFTNTTYLAYDGVMAGNFLGGSPFLFAEPSNDRVSIAITSIPSVGPSSGSGVLVKVFFRIKGTVTSPTENYFNIIKAFGYRQNGDTIRLYPQETRMIIQSATSVDDEISLKEFSLGQNYPNPFNPTSIITFSLPKETNVNLSVFDMMGNRIATLVDEKLSAGKHEIKFDATKYGLSSGVYLYSIKTPEFTSTKKMILMK